LRRRAKPAVFGPGSIDAQLEIQLVLAGEVCDLRNTRLGLVNADQYKVCLREVLGCCAKFWKLRKAGTATRSPKLISTTLSLSAGSDAPLPVRDAADESAEMHGASHLATTSPLRRATEGRQLQLDSRFVFTIDGKSLMAWASSPWAS
jgi:hypothetical protein